MKSSAILVVEIRNPVMQQSKNICQLCILCTGIFLIGFGSVILIFFDSIYDILINYNLKFASGTLAYQGWEKSPPVKSEIYMFNWTNPHEIGNLSVKPEFEELGPYIFYEVREKTNVTWYEDYVNYLTKSTYLLDKKNSGRNLSDVINSINTVALGVNHQLRYQSYWTKKMVSFGMSSKISDIHITKTVGEIVFNGYDDPILAVLSKIPMIAVPKKAGMFYGRNETAGLDGEYSMHFKNDEKFGEILLWNNNNQTDFYEGSCNNVKGSAGEFFPLNRKRDEVILFSADLCKALSLKYVEDVVIKGVHGYKYSAEYGFDNGTVYPENKCFCSGECIPTGVFNVSSCRMGSPTFLSFPNFFNADPIYREAVKGMKPNKTLHEFYFIIEPKSGIIMEVQAGMQVNMLLHPVSGIRLFQNVPRIFMPIFHVTHRVKLTDEIAEGLLMLQNLPNYTSYFCYIVITLGSVLVLASICSIFWCRKVINRKFPQVIITKDEQMPLNEKSPQINWKS